MKQINSQDVLMDIEKYDCHYTEEILAVNQWGEVHAVKKRNAISLKDGMNVMRVKYRKDTRTVITELELLEMFIRFYEVVVTPHDRFDPHEVIFT